MHKLSLLAFVLPVYSCDNGFVPENEILEDFLQGITTCSLARFMSSLLFTHTVLIYLFRSAAIPVGDSNAKLSNPLTGHTETQSQFSAPAFHVDQAEWSIRKPSSPAVANAQVPDDAQPPERLERQMGSNMQLHASPMGDERDLFASGFSGSTSMADAGHERANSLHSSSLSDGEILDNSGIRDSTTHLEKSR